LSFAGATGYCIDNLRDFIDAQFNSACFCCCLTVGFQFLIIANVGRSMPIWIYVITMLSRI